MKKKDLALLLVVVIIPLAFFHACNKDDEPSTGLPPALRLMGLM